MKCWGSIIRKTCIFSCFSRCGNRFELGELCLEVHIDDYCPLDRDDGRVFFSINCPCGDRVGWWLLLYHMMPCHHLRNSAHSSKLNSAGLLYNYFICICVCALWEFMNPRIFFLTGRGPSRSSASSPPFWSREIASFDQLHVIWAVTGTVALAFVSSSLFFSLLNFLSC